MNANDKLAFGMRTRGPPAFPERNWSKGSSYPTPSSVGGERVVSVA